MFENFKMGVNKVGAYFRENETGIILAHLSSGFNSIVVAIADNPEKASICTEYKKQIRRHCVKFGIRGTCIRIEPEKCYISDNECKFENVYLASGELVIRHKETGKYVSIVKVEDGIPLLLVEPCNAYGYEPILLDFFDVCSEDIKTLKIINYATKATIERTDTKKQIKSKMVNAIAEGLIKTSELSSVEFTEYGKQIICEAKLGLEKILIQVNKEGYGYCNLMGDDKKSPTNPDNLIYVIEAVKRFDYLQNVCCKYVDVNGKETQVTINKRNVNSILKDRIRKGKISLVI